MALIAASTLAAAIVYQTTARERDYRQLVARGDAALAADVTAEAIESYSGALALRPDSMLAHLRRGEAYLRRDELDDAVRDFREAATLDPAATRPLEEWGDALYRQTRYRRAIEVYEARLRLDERSASMQYRLALARYRDGNLQGAIDAAAAALRLDDRLTDAHYLTGLCLRDQGHTAEAISALERAVNRSAGHIDAREELADLYAKAGRTGDAMQQLQALAALDSDQVERRVAVGLAHARLGRTDLAILTLANVVEDAPEQMSAYAALGRVWLDLVEARSERPDALPKALEALERAASSSAATSETKTLYGRALMLAGQYEAAERMLQQATERFPADSRAFAFYAEIAEQQGHFDAARTALLADGALVPDDKQALTRAVRVGRLSLRLGDIATAIAWFERASTAAPSDLRPLLGLIESHLANSDPDAALEALGRAQQLAPADPQVVSYGRWLKAKA